MAKIGLLGCGNLVSAIIKGFYEGNEDHKFQFFCYTPSQKRAFELSQSIKGHFCQKDSDLKNLDVYIFGFKPQGYEDAVKQYQKIIPPNASIWSLLAGVSSTKIKEDFPHNPVLRIMPNTASKVRKGVTLYHHAKNDFTDYLLSPFHEIFGKVSELFFLKSDDMVDRVTGVSGSGPALIFEFANQLAQTLEELGVEGEVSKEIVSGLFIGASTLLNEEKNFEDLRNQVTSKKGVTFEALKVFESYHFDKMVKDAIQRAYERSVELRK